jgi:hypothetical protein
MAIKKRTQQERDREARIEAFGAAAEMPAEAPTPPVTPAPARSSDRRPSARMAEETRLPKTALIKYPDEELPRLLAEVAAGEERSHHATTIRALRRGLEIMKSELDRK